MLENKFTTKCNGVKMWQKRWTFSREAFGVRKRLRKEPGDRLVEKKSVKKQSGSDCKCGKLVTQISHSEVSKVDLHSVANI